MHCEIDRTLLCYYLQRVRMDIIQDRPDLKNRIASDTPIPQHYL